MSNLENNIKDCITKELEKGVIEKVIAEQLEKCVEKSISDMFGWGGEVKKVVEEKVKGVIIPYLESYDYSDYIIKLDHVLTNVLKMTTAENKKLLENFNELMSVDVNIRSIKVSEIFDRWCKYVAENVDTDDLEVDYDDGVAYETVEVSYEFEDGEKRSWLKQENGRIIFECEKDEKMNICIEVYRWSDIHKENEWSFSFNDRCELSSLRNLDKFSLYLMSLNQAGVKIELDKTYDNEDVRPEKEPEAYYD
ncbi:hypothetical protein [Clostridium paraputrificum]|uniref:hypothetical protein n=1 Tax=Clostridium paraputrificum TaxID=29363 RepID=UPI000DCFD8DB|nr:hypothetical protein [Clostridium paraputrificum]